MAERNTQLRSLVGDIDRLNKAIAEWGNDPRQMVVSFAQATAATGSAALSFGRKVEIKKVRLVNGDVDIEATTNLTVFDIDIEDGIGGKEHDLTAKASGVAVDADAFLELAMPALVARTVEATEIIKIIRTITLVQGECSLVFDYVPID